MITHKQAIKLASRWSSVNTWRDPGVWRYSFSNMYGVVDEKHRKIQIDYLNYLIIKVDFMIKEGTEDLESATDIRSLLEYIIQCPINAVYGEENSFFKAYLEAAMWSCYDDKERLLDENYHWQDIHPNSLEKMIHDCKKFMTDHGIPQYDDPRYTDAEKAGHDFWLTRAHHGTGFWDRDLPDDIGEKFTKAAQSFPECDLIIGDDNKIYVE